MRKNEATLHTVAWTVTLVLLITAQLTFFTSLTGVGVQATANNLTLVSESVYSSAGTPEIYPGSRSVTIMLDVRNDENYSISNVQGCFNFPEGITPTLNYGYCVEATDLRGQYKSSYDSGEVFRLETMVNVNKSVTPGTYPITVNVTYVLNTPTSQVKRNTTITANITISSYPPVKLRVTDHWWSTSHVYPGTSGATLYVRLRNNGSVSIRGGSASLILLYPLQPPQVRINLPSINSGEDVVLSFNQVDIPVTVKSGLHKALLLMNVSAVTDDGVTYSRVAVIPLTLFVSYPPKPYLKVIDAGWVAGVTYPNSRAVSIYVTIMNLDQSTINEVVATLHLPQGIRTRDGRPYVTSTYNAPVSFGGIFTLRFSNLNVSLKNLSTLNLNLTLKVVATYRGAEYVSKVELNASAKPVTEDVLKLVGQHWVWRGSVAEALPSAKGLTLELRLANLGQNAVSTIIPNITVPEGLNLTTYGGTCLSGVAPGSTCTLDLTFNVGRNVKPGTYGASLYTTYVMNVNGAYLYMEKTFNLTLAISSPAKFEPNLTLSKAWWGATGPTTVYGGERLAPIHVELTNLGRYAASDVFINVTTLNASVKLLDNAGICSTNLGPGIACRLTTYADLGNIVRGKLALRINVRYVISEYGAFIVKWKSFQTSLKVSVYAAQHLGNLELVSADWSNSQPVYPDTTGATYNVMLANHYPFNIVALDAYLTNLPAGITPHRGLNRAYVPGPVPSDQDATLTFTLDIGEGTSPGTYNATLVVRYVVSTGGASIFKQENFTVTLRVNQVKHGIEVITTGWAGTPAQPGTYGNVLYVALRNVDYSSVKGLVADIQLPSGFTSTINNESRVKVMATTSSQLASLAASNPTSLIHALSNPRQVQSLLSSMQPAGQLGKGDFAFLVIGLNVMNVKPGTYWANATLTFIDQWGDLRKQVVRIPIHVLGSALYIKVWTNTVLDFNVSRSATLTVNVLNNGSAPVYNVYIAVYSPMSYLLVKENPLYLGTLRPGEIKHVNLTVFFNPIPSGQSPVPITYGNMPFMATLIYTDVTGARHTYNASFTVSVSPFIKLELQDLKVVKEGNLVKVSGTITNLGNAQAQRVVVAIRIGSHESPESFVGDIDPSSQTSFAATATYYGNVSKVYVIIRYRNPFNEPREVVVPATVTEYVPTTTTTTTSRPGIIGGYDIYKVGTAAAVVVFLIIVGLLIRRYLKQHEVSAEVPV